MSEAKAKSKENGLRGESADYVIPGFIKKCFHALETGSERIIVWATGKETREFLYAEDCSVLGKKFSSGISSPSFVK
jgi:nucleoside-diphosphate-sugar epimerase